MSRGFSIEIKLEEETDGLSTYSVSANGWRQPQDPDQVASIKIDRNANTFDVTLKGAWKNEIFYFPTYAQMLDPSGFNPSYERINKTYRWWNVRLISAINRILTNQKYRDHVWFYQ